MVWAAATLVDGTNSAASTRSFLHSDTVGAVFDVAPVCSAAGLGSGVCDEAAVSLAVRFGADRVVVGDAVTSDVGNADSAG